MSDHDDLQRYAAKGDERAFGRVVGHYAGLVYGTALRRVHDSELAEEVSQRVFTLLARKSSSLKPGGLAGWLHRAAVLESSNAARKEQTRLRHLAALAAHSAAGMTPNEAQDEIRHLLDEALETLASRDRSVLLAHYFEGHSYAHIAAMRRETEAAVQRRASRALDTAAVRSEFPP